MRINEKNVIVHISRIPAKVTLSAKGVLLRKTHSALTQKIIWTSIVEINIQSAVHMQSHKRLFKEGGTLESKVITLCPKCLQKIGTARGTAQCPKYDNTPVCMQHCYNNCEYLDKSMSLTRCTYRQAKQREMEGIEHKKISLH